ncbi:ABC transporter substrate-binding protein [Bacillaceae bacterium S4-13-58]
MRKGLWIFIASFFIGATILIVVLTIDSPEQKDKVYQIGVLMTGNSRLEKFRGLEQGLYELGYEKGTFQFDVYNSQDNLKELETLAKEAVQNNPDILVALGAIEALTIKDAMEKQGVSIPVVFAGIAAPKELGLIDDYRNPGGMFTGVDNNHLNLSAKRLELLLNLVPSIERVIVLYDRELDVSVMSLERVKEAAKELDIPIVAFQTIGEPELFENLDHIVKSTDGLMVLPSFHIEALSKEISEFAMEHSLPTMGIFEENIQYGFLAGYGVPFFEQGFQSARLVSLILQGADPSHISVELPDQVKFLINDYVRKQIGVSLDQETSLLADFLTTNESLLDESGERP